VNVTAPLLRLWTGVNRPGAGVFVLSAGILAYEVVLMRMFSVALWHHFAAMIISVALLGFGLSGTLLALGWRPRFRPCAVGFALSAPVCGWLATRVPFNPLLMLWQPREFAGLFAVDLLLAIPFTCGALAIAVALMRGPATKTYAANLFGSGLGGLAGLALCFLPLPAPMSEYKSLSKTLEMHGAHITHTRYHPLGRVDVVEGPALRAAPGLSVAFDGTVPVEPVVFVDGEGGSPLAQDGAYLEWLPSAAPYQLGPRAHVLIIGVGGGSDVLQARRFGATTVTGVELHPRVAALASDNLQRAIPAATTHPAGVSPATDARSHLPFHLVVGDARAFLRRSRERYDLIQISLLDSFATTAAGVSAANENYLYTIEAMREMLAHLSDNGAIAITRWLRLPPRDEWKLANTAAAAGAHALFVRGWATGTLLAKRSPFRPDELAGLRRWAEQCAFTVEEAPVGRESLFDVRPATDDRPYFFHFFRWQSAPALLRALGRHSVAVTEWGYIIAVATLAQAALGSAVLIGLPALRARPRGAVLVYFASIGLGFMLLEITLLQKFVLILGHPLYAAATVLTTMLVLAGAGALRPMRDARWPAAVIIALGVAASLPLPGAVMFALLGALSYFLGMMFPTGLLRVSPQELPWAWGVNGCFSVIGAALAGVLAMEFGFRAVLLAAAALYAIAVAAWPPLSRAPSV
jgi:hypothetical protein